MTRSPASGLLADLLEQVGEQRAGLAIGDAVLARRPEAALEAGDDIRRRHAIDRRRITEALQRRLHVAFDGPGADARPQADAGRRQCGPRKAQAWIDLATGGDVGM